MATLLGRKIDVQKRTIAWVAADPTKPGPANANALEQIAHDWIKTYCTWVNGLPKGDLSASKIPSFWLYQFTARSIEISPFFRRVCKLVWMLTDPGLGSECKIPVENTPQGWSEAFVLHQCLERIGSPVVSHFPDEQRARVKRAYQRRRVRSRLAPFVFFIRGLARIWRAKSVMPPTDRGTVFWLSYAFDRALSQTRYIDPFFSTLPDALSALHPNLSSRFLFPLHTPSKLFKKISRIQPQAVVLAHYARLADLVNAAKAKAPLLQIPPDLCEPLLEDERERENSINEFRLQTWSWLTWKQFERHHQAKPPLLVHIFENHVWEKAMHHALQDSSVRRIGYQHATTPRLLANYHPISSEKKIWPSTVICNGLAQMHELQSMGWESDHLKLGPALRYEGLLSKIETLASMNPSTGKGARFFAFPGVPPQAEMLWEVLRIAVAGAQDPVLVKFHPDCQMPDIPGTITVTHSLFELMDQKSPFRIESVYYLSSTVGLESVLLGIPTYRLILDDSITLDPIPELVAKKIPDLHFTLEASRLRQHLRSDPLVARKPVSLDTAREAFAPADLRDSMIALLFKSVSL